MIGKKLESSKVLPLFEVAEHITAREADAELTYEQTLTKEYVNKFSRHTKPKGEKLIEELVKATGDEKLSAKMADLMPDSIERLRLLYPRGDKADAAQLEEALKIIKKYSK